MKRLFDVVVSAIGIAVLLPVMGVVALLIKMGGDGPVLFKQARVGRGMRLFNILKFRTMVVDAPKLGPGVTIGNDARVTPAGTFLRKTKLDELPQLFNVLRGDMSFVGPRPEIKRYVDVYPEDYAEVLKVRPGITDLASIVYRDESGMLARAKDPEVYYETVVLPDKIRMAKDYVRRSSLIYDLRLIMTTLVVLAYPKSAADQAADRLGRFRMLLSVAVHAVVFALANAAAFLIRFEPRVPDAEWQRCLALLPALLVVRLAAFHMSGLHRALWRYAGTAELLRTGLAVVVSSAVFWGLLMVIPQGAGYSRGVIVIDLLLCVVALGGLRLARREQSRLRTEIPRTRRGVLIASGDVADRVLRAMTGETKSGYSVIGVLERDSTRRGTTLHGVPVLGAQPDLAAVIEREDPDEILIAGESDAGVRSIRKIAAQFEKPVRAIPDLQSLVTGMGAASAPHGLLPEDLLSREPIAADPARLSASYAGRRVMITGAGGSIGSEICRQIATLAPSRVVLFEKHEASLFFIDRELRAILPGLEIVPVIGDITDAARVAEVMSATRPQVVFHAAAYKHVPMMEHHPSEAHKTNIIGTRVVAEAAERAGAEVFVLISTDKAVEPVSTMGLTKRVAELTVLGMNGPGKPRYMVVRFGNVLDSSGSVVPLFREQIERGGPITVTHAEVTRLFMTVPEAVQLILHAGTLGEGGEVFVLDMGKPVRILDLAKNLARLHGLDPGRDIDIVFTGLRPGERLFETLFNDHEKVWKTPHPKILMAANGSAGAEGRDELRALLATLEGRIRAVPVMDQSTPPDREARS